MRQKGVESMITNEKTRKSVVLRSMLIMIVLIAVVALIGFAYARYVTKLNGEVKADIAGYNFNVTVGKIIQI